MPHDGRDNSKKLLLFVGISQVLGIAMVILAGIWTSTYLGGFAWDGSSKEFNLHPLCMVMGFIFLYGEAILVYRVLLQLNKLTAKILHGLFHSLAFVAAIVGLIAVFRNHNHMGFANLYSLHSWIGLITVLLFGMQLVAGFVSFLFPGLSMRLRKDYLPMHQFIGTLVFLFCGVASISGIDEKLTFGKDNDAYKNLNPKAVVGNCLGLIIISYISVITYIIYNPEWKRPQSSEEEELSIYFRQVSSHIESDTD